MRDKNLSANRGAVKLNGGFGDLRVLRMSVVSGFGDRADDARRSSLRSLN